MDAAPAPVIIRDNAGRFSPGSVANPNGRPTIPLEVRKLLEDAAPRAVARLIELMESSDERIAATCSEAVLNRLYGKPSQVVDAKVETRNNIGQMHLEALQKIVANGASNKKRDTLNRDAGTADIIDVTPNEAGTGVDMVVGIAAREIDAGN